MGLWVVHFEAHLLEQRSYHRAAARPNILLHVGEVGRRTITRRLLGCMRMVGVSVRMAVTMIAAAAAAHIHLWLIAALHLQFLLLCQFLYRHETLLAHLYALGHVADSRILCESMVAAATATATGSIREFGEGG